MSFPRPSTRYWLKAPKGIHFCIQSSRWRKRMKRITRIGFTALLIVTIGIALVGCATTATSSTASEPQTQQPDLYGVWQGDISVQGTALTLQFAIMEDAAGVYQTKMSVPQQMTADLECSSTTIEHDTLTISIDFADITVVVQMDDVQHPTTLTGTYTQLGMDYPLVLSKTELDPATFNRRPQDPIPPYPYISQNVFFPQTVEQFTLAGTVTRPDDTKQHPAIVFVSGSGSQDRNENMMNHRPFLVLSDALTRAGYVVLRYDDRGYAQSGGDPSNATTFDLANDAAAALDWLKEQPYVDPSELFVLGHSEGGIIAPILASQRNDLAGIISLAGPGIPGKEISTYQSQAMATAMGLPPEVLDQVISLNKQLLDLATDSSVDEEQRKANVTQLLLDNGMPQDQIDAQIASIFLPWQQTFLMLDPAVYLRQVAIPALILNGDKDFQVPATLSIPAIEQAFAEGKKPDYTVIIYPNLNHLFQPCITGMLDEYYQIETTIEPQVLVDIVQWLDSVTD